MRCWSSSKEYLKITLSGALTATIIFSVYSYLAHIQSVIPMETFYGEGIACDIWWDLPRAIADCWAESTVIANEELFITTWMHSTDIAHEKWMNQCVEDTDFSSDGLFEFKFTSVRNYLIILFISTAIFVISAMVHDFTLIYHKNELHFVTFHPSQMNDYHCYYKISAFHQTMKRHIIREESFVCATKLIWYIISFFILIFQVIFLTLDIMYTLIIYPFVHSFGCYRNQAKRHHINAFSYVSASWVGVSRFFMAVATIMMSFKIGTDGFTTDISTLNPDCHCQCNYLLTEYDFYKFAATTSIFIIFSIKFLWSWLNEILYGHHHLYLVTYTLPIKYAHQINPGDCTGNMMEDGNRAIVLSAVSDANKERRLLKNFISELQEDIEDSNDNAITNTTRSNDDHMAFIWRFFLLAITTIYYTWFGSYAFFFTINQYNYYGYPLWFQAISSILTTLALGVGNFGTVFVWCYLQKKYHDRRMHREQVDREMLLNPIMLQTTSDL